VSTVPLQTLNPEAQARADWYAFLARIWYGGPDAQLLAAMAGADDVVAEHPEAPLEQAWRRLAQSAQVIDAETVCIEYDSVFVGTGKAEVTLYMAHYLPGETGKDRYLVQLRQLLQQWGLTRVEKAREPEDHLAALCEVMRHLILAGGPEERTLDRQAELFKRFLAPGYAAFAAAVRESSANFYKNVAGFTETFFRIEEQSFQML